SGIGGARPIQFGSRVCTWNRSVVATPSNPPRSRSRPTSGARQRPASSRFQPTISHGQRRRTCGSSATDQIPSTTLPPTPPPAAPPNVSMEDAPRVKEARRRRPQDAPGGRRRKKGAPCHPEGPGRVGPPPPPIPPRQHRPGGENRCDDDRDQGAWTTWELVR